MSGIPAELLEISPLITKVVDGQNLTSEEAEKVFTSIFLYDDNGLYFSVLLSSMHAKGESSDELLGLVNTFKNLGTNLNIKSPKERNIDLSGTGGGAFKTINVSTAASFVVAAAGYTVGKAAYYGITSPTGSADVFTAFGIDVAKLTPKQVENATDKFRLCPFISAYLSPKLVNFGKLAGNMYGAGLQIRNPLHLAVNIFSPYPTNHRIYGCYSEKYLKTIAELLMKMAFERSLVVYGHIGIPEISNVGKTTIVEQNGKKIKEYVVTPADLGVRQAKPEDIKTGGKEQNIIDFVNILQGKDRGAKADLVALNAGAALYSLTDVKSIPSGVQKAKGILESGEGYGVLKDLVNTLGSPKQLKDWDLVI